MSFAENLKQVRKEKNLSQEELAEILDVSRQAVSKWESGIGYPEVEKLLLLANRLNISLDSLLATEIAKENDLSNTNISGKILITSPNENVITTCYKVSSSGKCQVVRMPRNMHYTERTMKWRHFGENLPHF